MYLSSSSASAKRLPIMATTTVTVIIMALLAIISMAETTPSDKPPISLLAINDQKRRQQPNQQQQRADMYTNLIETRDPITETNRRFCVLDYVWTRDSTRNQSRGHWHDLYTDLYDQQKDICDLSAIVDPLMTNHTVLIQYSGDCDINQQIDYFNGTAIAALLVSVGCALDIDAAVNITRDTLRANRFPVALISQSSVDQMLKSPTTSGGRYHHHHQQRRYQCRLYELAADPVGYAFDYSILCIWLLATFTVTMGAYWSADSADTADTQKPATLDGEEAFINLSPLLVLCFVLMMAVMLCLLYFFYRYLVYVIIFLFILASIGSLFACFEPLIVRVLPDRFTRPSFIVCNVRCGKMYYYQLLLLIIAATVAITWYFVRRQPYAWLLQDWLGVCFSLNMLRTIRLPSYKICVILLSALFFYDIFFVFITPLITSKGNSVMVDVATGGSGGKSRCGTPGETIPMVMRVPHNIFKPRNDSSPMDVCYGTSDSLLGFGDILVPGLLVAYCYSFDLIANIKYRVYYLTTCIGYGVGLIATFAGLYLMSGSAQPALLYLVPFTMIPPLLIAWYRNDLLHLWSGPESYHHHHQQQQPSRCHSSSSRKSSAKCGPKTTATAADDNNLLITGSATDHHQQLHSSQESSSSSSAGS
ncbi:signal peptide peptidase-like 2A isoform X2 [Oppia nitens]|uniref:signal peptide peptidase-like 2A isoform X2 n=1 Tax=Oppia nitens TaxID=1686743 RepID=UPI0023D97FBB|nr:signal peptide peptidase-like 2A isoform X2 [Oppia nitens]